MTTSNSYNKHASHRSVDAEIERLAAQARLGWEKEARTLGWFGVTDGMRILELGSGPGFITAQLLEQFPHSPITCLEIDPALLARAEQYLADKADGRVRFVAGSVMGPGLDADQFDVAYGRFLFQHLPDPIGAAAAIRRVLKPGGRLIIKDIDDGLFGVFEPPIPALAEVIAQFGQAQAARGGDRQIGRRLWHILTAAGYTAIDLEVVAGHSGQIGIAPFLDQLDPDRLQALADAGWLSAEAVARFRADRSAFLAAPAPFTCWLSLMACGQRPR